MLDIGRTYQKEHSNIIRATNSKNKLRLADLINGILMSILLTLHWTMLTVIYFGIFDIFCACGKHMF